MPTVDQADDPSKDLFNQATTKAAQLNFSRSIVPERSAFEATATEGYSRKRQALIAPAPGSP